MYCQYGCGRVCHPKIDACIPCYRLIHGSKTANKILQWINRKQCSENDAVFKLEKFLLERGQDYLRFRLRKILEEMCLDDSGRWSRKFLRRMKQIPPDLLASLNNFYQSNPLNDEGFMDEFDSQLSSYCARRYDRSSSDEENVPEHFDGNNEATVASCSGTAQKRSHSPCTFPSGSDNDESSEPPKRKAQKIERNGGGKKRLHSPDGDNDIAVVDDPVQPLVHRNSNFTRRGRDLCRPRDVKGRFVKCTSTLPSHQSKKIRKTEVDHLTDSSFLGVGVDPYTLLDLPSLTRSGLKFR